MEQVDEKFFWVWLSGIPGIGARKFHALTKYFGGAHKVWQAPKEKLTQLSPYLGSNVVYEIINQRDNKTLDGISRMLNSSSFRIITLLDDEYPDLLKQIYDPPPVLYGKGCPIINHKPAISIVGSRRPTGYGRQMAEKLAYELAEAGVTIVSGLARGVDAMAHYGALKAKGTTVGVLGCGIDRVYPPENKKLFSSMVEKGTIITEYPPGSAPVGGNFPARNRIISGMTSGVLVIEAGERSGALITVDFALEQGRDVYALPGNINVAQSAGTNKILKEGAKLVTEVQDILEELGIQKKKLKKDTASVQLDFLKPRCIMLSKKANDIWKNYQKKQKWI